MDQRRTRLHHRNGATVVAGRNRLEQLIGFRRGVETSLRFALLLFLFFDDGDYFVVPALCCNCQRRGGLAMGIDSFTCVGAMLHQHTHHFGRPGENGVVQNLKIACRHVRQLRTDFEHRPRLYEVAGTYGGHQPLDGDTVHVRLELGPTVEAIGACQDKLRVVQGEVRRIRLAVVCVHLGDSVGLSRSESLQQFFGLPLELIEIRVLAKRAGRQILIHNELLPGLRFLRQPLRPVSAGSGRKEFIEATMQISKHFRGTQSFPRTRWRPETPEPSYHVPTDCPPVVRESVGLIGKRSNLRLEEMINNRLPYGRGSELLLTLDWSPRIIPTDGR